MAPPLGAHMSIAGGAHKAVAAAQKIGATTLQIFTKSNHQWRAAALSDEAAERFRSEVRRVGLIKPIAHNSYLINLASGDPELWQKSVDAMVIERERAWRLGLAGLVLHPGSHGGDGEDVGLDRVAEGLEEILDRTSDFPVPLLLETTAGQGTNLGYRFEHLGTLLERFQPTEEIGTCVDTCHIFAAGYEIRDERSYRETMDQYDECVGLDTIAAFHMNDSVRELGSRVDRHAGLGRGEIGLDAFGFLINDPRFEDRPMVLETPKGDEDGEDLDVRNLRILRELIERRQGQPRSKTKSKSKSKSQARSGAKSPGTAKRRRTRGAKESKR